MRKESVSRKTGIGEKRSVSRETRKIFASRAKKVRLYFRVCGAKVMGVILTGLLKDKGVRTKNRAVFSEKAKKGGALVLTSEKR